MVLPRAGEEEVLVSSPVTHPSCSYRIRYVDPSTPFKGDRVDQDADVGRPPRMPLNTIQGLLGKARRRAAPPALPQKLLLKLTSSGLQENDLVFLGKQPGEKASLARREQGRPLAKGRGARARGPGRSPGKPWKPGLWLVS